MKDMPTVVCLCGSTRFSAEYQKANLEETLKGNIVLTIGCDMKSDVDLFQDMNADELKVIKDRLDELHKRKIDLADEVLVLNVGGYVGSSTMDEIEYAISQSKRLRWLEPMSSKGKSMNDERFAEIPSRDEEQWLEDMIAEDAAREEALRLDCRCCICGIEPVDALNGYDTCRFCLP